MPAGSPPIRTIANGVSTEPYKDLPSREDARAQLGLPKASFVVGIVARVSGQKGHLLLIDVFARILRKVPGALLLIIGDGAGMPAVKSRIQELGVAQHVLLMGARNDVPLILKGMDVFCLPSEMEGMPMTVLEAMAAGLPVVTSNVGGLPELVEEGKTGLMVPPRSPEPLEAALLALAEDASRAKAMGGAGRERLLNAFSLDQTIAEYEEVYRKATGRVT
jgi:glycosyltransferase involved in cell wall biosynthesis